MAVNVSHASDKCSCVITFYFCIWSVQNLNLENKNVFFSYLCLFCVSVSPNLCLPLVDEMMALPLHDVPDIMR